MCRRVHDNNSQELTGCYVSPTGAFLLFIALQNKGGQMHPLAVPFICKLNQMGAFAVYGLEIVKEL